MPPLASPATQAAPSEKTGFINRKTAKIRVAWSFIALAIITVQSLMVKPIFAQEGPQFFRSDPVLQPLRSEPRAPMVKVSVGGSSHFPYLEPSEKDYRKAYDIQLGTELPVFSLNDSRGAPRFSAWIPIDFHLIYDGQGGSAPLINGDYRFGLTFKYQHPIGEAFLGARYTFWAHESPHLGDEYTFAASKMEGFRRINVAYEFSELRVQYERAFTRIEEIDGRINQHINRLRAQIGFTRLWPNFCTLGGQDGSFYWWDEEEVGPNIPTKSTRLLESAGGGIEFETDKPIFGKSKTVPVLGWGWFVSTDLRWRIQYNYDKPIGQEHVKEKLRPAINILIGIKDQDTAGANRGRLAVFFRYYHGVNPHGQFRDLNNYRYFGGGLMAFL